MIWDFGCSLRRASYIVIAIVLLGSGCASTEVKQAAYRANVPGTNLGSSNPLQNGQVVEGDAGLILKSEIRIEVNIPATQMTVFEGDRPIFIKPVAVGQPRYPTPLLDAEIKRIEWNPWWYPPPAPWAKGDKVTPPGPRNPLGPVKMPISNAILFHGTNKEKSVGRAASHGCMRMLNADAQELAWFLQSRFSQKSDPSLREVYQRNRKQTYVVGLDAAIPVRVIYEPAVVRNGVLIIYPDFYNKFSGKKREFLMNVLASSGVPTEKIDEEKLINQLKVWPTEPTEIPISDLIRNVVSENERGVQGI